MCSHQNHVTCSLLRYVRTMSPAPGWPIIPELFSILGYAYYSQNYSGIISSSLLMCLFSWETWVLNTNVSNSVSKVESELRVNGGMSHTSNIAAWCVTCIHSDPCQLTMFRRSYTKIRPTSTLTLNMLSFWGHECHYQYCCDLLHEQKWCMGHGEVAVLVDSLKARVKIAWLWTALVQSWVGHFSHFIGGRLFGSHSTLFNQT